MSKASKVRFLRVLDLSPSEIKSIVAALRRSAWTLRTKEYRLLNEIARQLEYPQ